MRKGKGPWGFTLVELLTVIAIIAILATLLASGLASAKRKGRKSVSISNLRQIALGVNLYLDDHNKRPASFGALTTNRYLSGRVLACPEDKTTNANWAQAVSPAGRFAFFTPDVPHSYFQSFTQPDIVWDQIMKAPFGGFAACQLHGIGRPNWQFPSADNYQGVILRVLKDGAVVTRQVFPEAVSEVSAVSDGFGNRMDFFLDPE